MIGQALGSVLFGVLAVITAYRLVARVAANGRQQGLEADRLDEEELSMASSSPLSSSCTQMGQMTEELEPIASAQATSPQRERS